MMKKIAAWIILGVILLSPAGAYAAQPSYRVAGYAGDMVMGADGSLSVTEYITWQVKGAPTLTRRLDISSATSVENVTISKLTGPDQEDPENAERVALRKSGGGEADTYDWTLSTEGNGRFLDMTLYPEIQDRTVTLVFSYTFTDCAYLYQDGAAFSFNPLWQAGEGTLKSFFLHCRLGGDMDTGEGQAQYFANGGLVEEWTGPDLFATDVDLSTGLEVVAVLPVSWVPEGRKTVMNEILPHLTARQHIYQAQRDEMIAHREKALRRSRLTLWVAAAMMAGGIVLIFFLYGIRPPRKSQHKGFLLPGRHVPGEVRLLLRRPLTRQSALSELIYLWHKGFVRFVTDGDEWSLAPSRRSDERLSLHDQYLLSWMVHHGGNETLWEKLSDPTAFGIWKRLVKKAVDQQGILQEARAAWIIGLGLGVMEWVLAAMIYANVGAWDTALLVALMGMLVAGYGLTVRKVSAEEIRERTRYRTYARQLRGEDGCAGPWRRQLAYAMVLGAQGRILNILSKKGGSDVRAFARWVKKQCRIALPPLKIQGRGPNPFKAVKSSRHEAAAGKTAAKQAPRPEPKATSRPVTQTGSRQAATAAKTAKPVPRPEPKATSTPVTQTGSRQAATAAKTAKPVSRPEPKATSRPVTQTGSRYEATAAKTAKPATRPEPKSAPKPASSVNSRLDRYKKERERMYRMPDPKSGFKKR